MRRPKMFSCIFIIGSVLLIFIITKMILLDSAGSNFEKNYWRTIFETVPSSSTDISRSGREKNQTKRLMSSVDVNLEDSSNSTKNTILLDSKGDDTQVLDTAFESSSSNGRALQSRFLSDSKILKLHEILSSQLKIYVYDSHVISKALGLDSIFCSRCKVPHKNGWDLYFEAEQELPDYFKNSHMRTHNVDDADLFLIQHDFYCRIFDSTYNNYTGGKMSAISEKYLAPLLNYITSQHAWMKILVQTIYLRL